ncbi:MAG: coenzyme F420-0:L-glutamate ligase [Phototrophicaceae bacterium]
MPIAPSFQVQAISGVPMVQAGDDLPKLILDALKNSDMSLETGDILVIASKIVSKSEGRIVALADVSPSEEAIRVALEVDKDPRIVELVLAESEAISRQRKGVLVTEHRLGFVSANSGLDASNVDDTNANVLLLPINPDESAQKIHKALESATGQKIAIVITDTHGRPFRLGNTGVAIGIAGMQALWDRRGERDLFGREMMATILGYGDLVASTAHLVMGEGAEGLPLVLIRGLKFPQGEGKASDLNRPRDMDMYR